MRRHQIAHNIKPWDGKLGNKALALVVSDAEEIKLTLDYIGTQQVLGCAKTR